jgi:hypothetical protein
MSIWDNSFEPQEIQVLSAAFERAWDFIERSGDAGMDMHESRASLARHVMAIARAGEMNPLRLTNAAIHRYRQQRVRQFAAVLEKRADDSAA